MSQDFETTDRTPAPDGSEGRAARRRASERASAWSRLTARPGLVAAIVVAAVLVLAVAVDAAASAGRIHPGVRVDGVAVGGKTVEIGRAHV